VIGQLRIAAHARVCLGPRLVAALAAVRRYSTRGARGPFLPVGYFVGKVPSSAWKAIRSDLLVMLAVYWNLMEVER